jgi:hypothetical protein
MQMATRPEPRRRDPRDRVPPLGPPLGPPRDVELPALIGPLPEMEEYEEAAPSAVRGYAWTGGRTTPKYRLEIETLLSTTDHYREHDESTPTEYHAVAALCHQVTSVAEVAALLRLPLGIAKVLAGDMAASGLLLVHKTASVDGESPDMMLMERILSGLRRL